MTKKYQAVIFDLDGTLLNTLEDLHGAVNHTMSALNCPLRALQEVKSFVGNGIKKLIERSLPVDRKSDVGTAYEIFCEYYAEHNAEKTVPYAGMVGLIERLKQKGVGMGVVTNKADFAAQALCQKFFGDAFTAVIGAKENLPRKPDPAGVRKALSVLNVSAENAVYVGDSDVDYYTAKNAGVDCVLVSWGFRDKPLLTLLKPLTVADDIEQLQRTLLGE